MLQLNLQLRYCVTADLVHESPVLKWIPEILSRWQIDPAVGWASQLVQA